jgi:hypothetical protein
VNCRPCQGPERRSFSIYTVIIPRSDAQHRVSKDRSACTHDTPEASFETPRVAAPQDEALALRLSIRAALAKTSLNSGVVGKGKPAAGSIQSTASTSSLKRGSPRVHRATNEATTKWAGTRSPSGMIASTCRLKGDDLRLDANLFHKLAGERGGERFADFDDAAGQAEMAEQGRPRPAHDEDARCRNTAAESARIGRAGNTRSYSGSPI